MTRSILRPVIGGIIVGALAFFVPHFLLGIFIFMLLIRLLHGCGRGYGCHGGYGHRHGRMFYMADKIRQMSNEEYAEFKTKMNGGYNDFHHHFHSGRRCGCECNSDYNFNNETKKEETTK